MAGCVLVTGGAGFIGSHLVERLLEAGESVTAVDDLSRGRREWLDQRAQLHEADLRDRDGMLRAIREIRPDVVVHLAAMHFIPAVDDAPELARDVNVNGTESLLEALVPHPPRLLVFASTAAVYPDRQGPIDETCPLGPLDVYGRTKLDGEHLVADFASRTGTRSIVARIFNVIGRRETNPHVVPELVEQLRLGRTVRLGNLEPKRDYTDVRDVASALHALIGSRDDDPTTFNVGSGRAVSVGELLRICEEILGGSVSVESDPRRRRPHDRQELLADAGLLRRTTGWKPTHPLRETLSGLLGRLDAA